jgi:predicted metal-dependent hydrolase
MMSSLPSPLSLPVVIRRHATARRMILRLSPCGTQLQLTLPKRSSEKAGMDFIHKQQEWIARQLRKQQEHKTDHAQPLTPNSEILLFGITCRLQHCAGQRGVVYNGETLMIGGTEQYFSRRVKDWIIQEALTRFSKKTLALAKQIGKTPAAVTVRDTKTRWGSCSKTRRISLCWRLAFAPEAVASYVIAHEVAHLAHFNHSPAFWQVVATLDSSWQQSRDWLKHHGKTLHLIG